MTGNDLRKGLEEINKINLFLNPPPRPSTPKYLCTKECHEPAWLFSLFFKVPIPCQAGSDFVLQQVAHIYFIIMPFMLHVFGLG